MAKHGNSIGTVITAAYIYVDIIMFCDLAYITSSITAM
jgi:hypothetical protein